MRTACTRRIRCRCHLPVLPVRCERGSFFSRLHTVAIALPMSLSLMADDARCDIVFDAFLKRAYEKQGGEKFYGNEFFSGDLELLINLQFLGRYGVRCRWRDWLSKMEVNGYTEAVKRLCFTVLKEWKLKWNLKSENLNNEKQIQAVNR